RYTVFISPADNAPANSPDGYGYMTVTNKIDGAILSAGKLSDGTVFSPLSMPLSKDGKWPVYQALYGNRGLLEGWMTFSDGTLTGFLTWIKPTTNNLSPIKSYHDGFTNELVSAAGRA